MYFTTLFTILFFSLLDVALGGGEGIVVTEIKTYEVPTFTIQELKDGSRKIDLETVLGTTGLLSVIGSDQDTQAFKIARQNAFVGLCKCMKTGSDEFSSVEGVDSSMMSDETSRITLATATVGSTPLPLRKVQLEAAGCAEETIQAMEYLRDYVAWGSQAFVTSLDALLVKATPFLQTTYGAKFMSVASIIKASQNLEHFHVYNKSIDAIDRFDLDFHTDAGLFLSFVPGMECDSEDHVSKSDDFYIQIDGETYRAKFPENSIGMMLGVGAEHWLNTPKKLVATRHAVSMSAGQNRAWYGMMHLVPHDAIIQDFPQRTFADMRKAMVLNGMTTQTYSKMEGEDVELQNVAIGCGGSSMTSLRSLFGGETRINRRRLGMVDNASACNNVTNFFCWMSCLAIPDHEDIQEKVNEGLSLYCLDAWVLEKTGNISSAVSECDSRSHNDGCTGSWQPTEPGLPSQPFQVDEESMNNASLKFCYGGTSMYMDGFHWINSTCVIYLFPSWVLSSAGLVAVACIGTLFFGALLEFIISKRRLIVQSAPTGWKRVVMSTLFYGLQLTFGYLLMLVVMTYSGPLFMCVVLGLMSGHAMFNASGSSSAKNGTERESDFVDGESQEAINPAESNVTSEPNAPEGFTPCCQNQL